MDLHALSQGRSMLLARGGIAFVIGVVASNQPGISATSLVVIWGAWALAEGAASLRQAYPSSGTSRRAEAPPVLLVLGGVALAVGVLAVAVPGLSPAALTWLLAGWFAARAVIEGLGASVASSKERTLLGMAALVDLGLVALFVTHTTGSMENLALFGGGLALLWGLLHLVLGLLAAPLVVITAEGPRLLARR
jgi:uncharacterized membrane protein HdeD (DUF308 family)